ncbi:hypothetical protein HYPSUDRAFT_38651 [Hypholoma sublateritium FD-334 SS-4]|uniref:Uncharacterized protein n=1 Tax=Hypholoma sublateritium (strain FD-334 SS-4) TaxID=945553 RepID=A0A0D2P127_HYPSF|nr:hypothetical protein HYPSUDRAFT_38651 [Hypholoma sublateritium FD-334 SS-4]
MSARINANAFARTLKKLVPTKGLPPVLKPRCGNLYEVLSRTPTGGIGMEVHQTRWSEKNIPNCYWVVTRSQFKLQGTHGKAWGRLHWKGVPISIKDEIIRGSLKYTWKEGRSIQKAGTSPVKAKTEL